MSPQRHRDTKVWRLNEDEHSISNCQTFVSLCLCGDIRIHQYPIIRPAMIAVSQHKRETPPATANCNCSRDVRFRTLRSFQAGRKFRRTTFKSPRPMAGNLMYRNGLPMYSVALVASRQTPLVTAMKNPDAASGIAGSVTAARVI